MWGFEGKFERKRLRPTRKNNIKADLEEEWRIAAVGISEVPL